MTGRPDNPPDDARRHAHPRRTAAALTLAALSAAAAATAPSVSNVTRNPGPPDAMHQLESQPRPSQEPLAWAREFLPHHFTDPPCDFHAQLLADLHNPDNRLLARVAPRGHAKSTCAALAFPLWCICERKKHNILIITHESSLATQFVRDIRNELETNDRIQLAYGDLCADDAPPSAPDEDRPRPRPRAAAQRRARSRSSRLKWSQDVFTTATGITVQAKSAGASLRGTRAGPHRPDLIICDDIEKDELVESPGGRRKLEHWLRRVVMPALAPDGQLLILGSIIHYDSLLANLRHRARWPRWNYRVYRALEARPAPDGTHRLHALWPARWPVERLQLERERVGTLAFEQEYQANPIDHALRAFRPEWLRRYDPADLEGRTLLNLMAVDPATGAADGDFFALWIGSVDPSTGVIYTRRLVLDRINIVEQIRRIVDAFRAWRPLRIGIETTAYQVALKDVLDDLSRREGLYMPVVPIQTVANKRARIEGSAPFFENGTFRLPPDLDPEIEAQFLQFPKSRHDDAPDVCAMAIELARSFRSARAVEGATAARNPYSRRGGW